MVTSPSGPIGGQQHRRLTSGARSRREDLERSWAAWLAEEAEPKVRAEVLASWRLSRSSVAADIRAAPVDSSGDAVRQWRESPVQRAASVTFDRLRTVADDHGFVAAITDRDGVIVWSHGGRLMRRRAERVNFTPGGRWDERSAGTNALGLALRTHRPAEVWSAEHFSPMVHDWVCYSAPILHPATHDVLGVVDLSCSWQQHNPLGLVTATSIADCIHLQLGADGSLPDSSTGEGLVMRALGGHDAFLDGCKLTLTPRQFEMATILSLFPDGLSLDELHTHLHGDRPVHVSTTKAEASHLRTALGGALLSRPYRLGVRVRSDHADVLDHLEHGRVSAAVDAYRGPLLPLSESPLISERRHYVHMALRAAVLATADPPTMFAFGRLHPEDSWVQEELLRAMDPRDPRRPLAMARLAVITGPGPA